MHVVRTVIGIMAMFASTACLAQDGEYKLRTRWAADVSPENVHNEYPRPQLVRPGAWTSLNGLWQYAIRPRDADMPTAYDGEVLVPFAVESALSGVQKAVGAANRLWYRRTFKSPLLVESRRLLLHFGAVDWRTTVWIDGEKVGEHEGGYDAFTFDISDALGNGDEHELIVSVWDPTDEGFQPRGKQVREPHGICYTAVTGIWQTVWLEIVPRTSIESIRVTPDIDTGSISVEVKVRGNSDGFEVLAIATTGLDPASVARGAAGTPLRLQLKNPRLWSPDSPFLYELLVQISKHGLPIDRVRSYFGMRKIEIAKDDNGVNRLFLNNEPLFQLGLLDQGWWPDGLYTAPSDAALRYDVEVTKQLGFNMIRKHVKREPARWYYHCDQLGVLVWQDMPSGDAYIGGDDPDITRSPESRDNFYREYGAMMDQLHNHPSIVVWVPFNEGWGQFETDEVMAWTKQRDPSRLVDGPSGWTDRGTGDMHDVHRYPGPAMPPVENARAAVLGEFGGLGLPTPGHVWRDRDNWGYRNYDSATELTSAYTRLLTQLRMLIADGLAAAVYTQTTDVEGEVNGVMTYDRDVIKMNSAVVAAANARMFKPPPTLRTIVPTSQTEGRPWRFTTTEPTGEWTAPSFDDAAWREGLGGLGAGDPPGARIRTEWSTPAIWARRTFELNVSNHVDPHLIVYHDEDAEVYLNGRLVASCRGYVTSYVLIPINDAALLQPGRNVIAVHCRQTAGGQFIDVGVADLVPPNPD